MDLSKSVNAADYPQTISVGGELYRYKMFLGEGTFAWAFGFASASGKTVAIKLAKKNHNMNRDIYFLNMLNK